MKRGLILVLALFFIVPAVSASYDGGFYIDRESFQLGDEFTITGSNINFEGMSYNGNAMIHLDGGENNTYILLTEISGGSFSYIASFCELSTCNIEPANGTFSVDIELLDLQLDELHRFSEVLTFDLTDVLDVTLGLENSQLDPGDKLSLTGSAFRSVDSTEISEMTVEIVMDDFETELVEDTNAFSYDTTLASTVLSNYHDLNVTIWDKFGNRGFETIRFYVTPVPNWMEINVDGSEFLPGVVVAITASVYDQADVDTSNDVEFKLVNPKGRKVVEDTLHTSEVFNFELDEYALPGEWELYAEYEGLEAESFFVVREVELLDIRISNQTVVVVNAGNNYYDKNLVIVGEGEGEKRTIDRRTNLNPGEEISLNLYELFDTGYYKVRITNTGDEYELQIRDPRGVFSRVGGFFSGLTGQAVGKSGTGTSDAPTIIMVVLFLAGLIVFSVRVRTRKNRVRTPGYFPEKKRRMKIPKFKRKKKGDVESLKERILDDIESSGNTREKKAPENGKNYNLPPGFGDVKEPKNKPDRVDFDRPLGQG